MKLLLVGGAAADLRVAKLGLAKRGWTVDNIPTGTRAWHEPEALAAEILGSNPDVVYSPALFEAGRRVVAAYDATSAARRPWLTGVSAFDFMADYQPPEAVEQVHIALRAADALLPQSRRHAAAAREAGFSGAIFAATRPFFELGLQLMPRHGLGSPARTAVVVDGAHGLTARGLVAIAALRNAGDALSGRDVIVVNAARDAHIAASVLGTDMGARVRTLPPQASTAQAVLDAHARAVCSISLSLDPDVRWTEIAAMSEGALPIVSRGAGITSDLGAPVCCEQVDPEDPTEIAEALRRVLADAAQRHSDRARNASIVRDWFDFEEPEAAFAAAVSALAAHD